MAPRFRKKGKSPRCQCCSAQSIARTARHEANLALRYDAVQRGKPFPAGVRLKRVGGRYVPLTDHLTKRQRTLWQERYDEVLAEQSVRREEHQERLRGYRRQNAYPVTEGPIVVEIGPADPNGRRTGAPLVLRLEQSLRVMGAERVAVPRVKGAPPIPSAGAADVLVSMHPKRQQYFWRQGRQVQFAAFRADMVSGRNRCGEMYTRLTNRSHGVPATHRSVLCRARRNRLSTGFLFGHERVLITVMPLTHPSPPASEPLGQRPVASLSADEALRLPPEEILRLAADPTTPSALLGHLSRYPWAPLALALADNPACPTDALVRLSHVLPQRVAKNALMQLLVLENAQILRQVHASCARSLCRRMSLRMPPCPAVISGPYKAKIPLRPPSGAYAVVVTTAGKNKKKRSVRRVKNTYASIKQRGTKRP